jgi:predicted RNase H-like HicB family nuclease
MTDGAHHLPGVELRDTGSLVVAHHEPTGVSSNGETAAEAIRMLADGVAFQTGSDLPVDHPEAFFEEIAEDDD